MRFLVALILSAVLAPVASANPARDLTKAGASRAPSCSPATASTTLGDLHASQRFRVGSVTKTFVARPSPCSSSRRAG